MRVVGYLRVSTSEQAESGLGLEAQRAAIAVECDRRGWELVDTYEDAGISGKALQNRAGLAAALAAIEGRARLADGVVVAKLDRLTRSLKDFADLLERARAKRWNLVALDLGIDLSTPAGEFLASVMAAAAQWERRIIGQRTKDALAVKRAQGTRLGRPRTIAPELACEIVDMHRSGSTYSAIARELNRRGVPTAHAGREWHDTTIRALVINSRRE